VGGWSSILLGALIGSLGQSLAPGDDSGIEVFLAPGEGSEWRSRHPIGEGIVTTEALLRALRLRLVLEGDFCFYFPLKDFLFRILIVIEGAGGSGCTEGGVAEVGGGSSQAGEQQPGNPVIDLLGEERVEDVADSELNGVLIFENGKLGVLAEANGAALTLDAFAVGTMEEAVTLVGKSGRFTAGSVGFHMIAELDFVFVFHKSSSWFVTQYEKNFWCLIFILLKLATKSLQNIDSIALIGKILETCRLGEGKVELATGALRFFGRDLPVDLYCEWLSKSVFVFPKARGQCLGLLSPGTLAPEM
jgi:hypothetical protein